MLEEKTMIDGLRALCRSAVPDPAEGLVRTVPANGVAHLEA